jgi:hypothetical protein
MSCFILRGESREQSTHGLVKEDTVRVYPQYFKDPSGKTQVVSQYIVILN